jgi:uncharacterized protein (DUF952 family)
VRIFHLATLADWTAAQASGRYTTSTRGRTLAEEGFIHASRADQWQGVRERFYADVTEPLVLLVIDTDRLDAPVVEEEAVPGSGETFPQVYGAIAPDAVVQVLPVDSGGTGAGDAPTRTPAVAAPSFSHLFLGELMHQVVLASVVLGLAVLGALVGLAVDDAWGPLVGTATGLAVGVVAARLLHRRRRATLG